MDFFSIIRDANRFVLYNRAVIENAPLQSYVSALVFSPSMSKIRTLFQHQQPSWIFMSPLVEENWNPCLQTLEGHTEWVNSVTFSPNGRRLASGSYDETVRIWDAETGALQQTLEGHTSPVYSVTFSPNGRQLASSSQDKTVRIWDAETGALQQTLEGHTDWVNLVTFSLNGRWLASGSNDKTVRIWDAETGALQQTLEIGTSLTVLLFSPDEHSLITELGCIALSQSSVSSRTPNWSAYCLHTSKSWIIWNNKNVLWLPPEYRPVASEVRKQTVAIGCNSGRLLLLRFHPEIPPLQLSNCNSKGFT